MEHMFQRHRYVLFSEVREFSFYLKKLVNSFFKIVWELARLFSLLVKYASHFFLESQVMYRSVSPGKREVVEKPFIPQKPWMQY